MEFNLYFRYSWCDRWDSYDFNHHSTYIRIYFRTLTPMKIVLISILIGNMTITSYRSVPEQTDSSPFITATGEHVTPHGVALSRDLLKRWGGPIDYGDYIYIEGHGIKVVNDCMADYWCSQYEMIKGKKRCIKKKYIRKHVDIWVKTYKEEKKIGWSKGYISLIQIKGEKQ